MPTTITALVIILFAILPGLPAYYIYKMRFGRDWRATDWENIVGIFSFSTGGLVLYIILSSLINLPPPIYVIPETFNTSSYGISSLYPIALSYLGHLLGAIIVALLAILVKGLITKWTPMSPYPAAWDNFIRVDLERHWVVVKLNNGDAYAGIINNADISVGHTERDIVLVEPALYDGINKNFKATPYQKLFIPAALISSIAVVSDPDIDKRITPIGSILFLEDKTDV